VPLAAKVGDSFIAIVAVSDRSTVLGLAASQPDFDVLATLETTPAASSAGQVFVLRHVIEDGEPTLEVVLSATPTTFGGVALLYRDLEPEAAAIEASIVDIAASADFDSPSLTLTRYSDIYLGIAFATTAAVTFTPPVKTSERADFTSGSDTLTVFELLAEATGATGTKTAVASSAQSGMAASILLRVRPTPKAPSVVADVPGAIGLVTVGV
jgi:hypothetical protein